MRSLCITIIILSCIVNANPILRHVINELQVAPFDSQRVELHYFERETADTIYGDTIPLINTPFLTPAGSSYVDTNIYFAVDSYAVIDPSVLSGSFGLPYDSGYISTYHNYWYLDSVVYPDDLPGPPYNASVARFHCFCYDSTWYPPWCLIDDWYIDSTPTFGHANDDYPGCIITGHVYDYGGSPIGDARVTARIDEWGSVIYNPPQYSKCCTTFTDSQGTYSFDSLLPLYYYVDVDAEGFMPDTQMSSLLKNVTPDTIDFYMQTGIAENRFDEHIAETYIYPNPIRNSFNIVLSKPSPDIKIYDVTGKLQLNIENKSGSNKISINCSPFSNGIYFIVIDKEKFKVIKY
ncbi:MAG: T9SS type A sorting domain-containing protein [bacterium]